MSDRHGRGRGVYRTIVLLVVVVVLIYVGFFLLQSVR